MAAAFSGGGRSASPTLHPIVQHKGLLPGPARWGFVCGSRGGGPGPPCVGSPNPEPGCCGRALPKGVGETRRSLRGKGGVPLEEPPPAAKRCGPFKWRRVPSVPSPVGAALASRRAASTGAAPAALRHRHQNRHRPKVRAA